MKQINKFRLWLFFGFVWITPQIIILKLPEKWNFIIPLLMVVFGSLIVFTNFFNKFLLEDKPKKKV